MPQIAVLLRKGDDISLYISDEEINPQHKTQLITNLNSVVFRGSQIMGDKILKPTGKSYKLSLVYDGDLEKIHEGPKPEYGATEYQKLYLRSSKLVLAGIFILEKRSADKCRPFLTRHLRMYDVIGPRQA